MDFCVFYCCCCFLEQFIARNPLYPSQTTCGCETSMLVVCQVTICLQLEELATNHFHWLKNVYVAVSNWTRAVPFFFCPIGEIFSFPMCWCVCGSRCLSVKNTSTSVRKGWSIHILKYVKVRQHNFWSSLEKRVGEDKFRSIDSDSDASNLRTYKTSEYVFSTGFLVMNFFFIYTQYIWLTFLECNWMQKKVPVHEL